MAALGIEMRADREGFDAAAVDNLFRPLTCAINRRGAGGHNLAHQI